CVRIPAATRPSPSVAPAGAIARCTWPKPWRNIAVNRAGTRWPCTTGSWIERTWHGAAGAPRGNLKHGRRRPARDPQGHRYRPDRGGGEAVAETAAEDRGLRGRLRRRSRRGPARGKRRPAAG